MILPMLMLPFVTIQVASQEPIYGPRMDFLHIVNYGDPSAEYAALELDEIDTTDWPLTPTWVERFSTNPEIVMTDFTESGTYEYDIYNQKWPTGCDGMAPHTRQRPETGAGDGNPPSPGHDWDPETETWKVYFDPNCPHCQRAWGFRLALAYLTDKDYVRTQILKGYGLMLDTWLTAPQAGWIDMNNLTASSFTYEGPNGNVEIPSLVFNHDVDKAKALLDAAGFTMITSGPDAGKRQDPREAAGQALDPLLFWIRLDDPNRKAAGEKLAADMQAVGIPVSVKVVEKTVCYKAVMIEYDYHIYTGGYSWGADPWEILEGVCASWQYWAPIGWSGGYQGFCNVEADEQIKIVKEGVALEEIEDAVHKATYLVNKYVSSIPLWSSAGVNAYRKGWDGVVNHEGYGITYGTGGVYFWSLFNMRPTPGGPYDGDDTLDLAFKSDPIEYNVVTSQWVWDWIVLDTIYEPLLVRNPYNLGDVRGMLAESYTTETWDTDKIAVTYTLKPNIKWHDGTTLTPEDVKWGLDFIKDCGPGVAWNIFQVRDIDHIDTQAEDSTLGALDVKIYYETGSFWAAVMAGFCEFPSRKIWMAASEAIGFGYDPETHSFEDVTLVRQYHPWEMDVYDAATGGVGEDGILDLAQDGTGPWIFVEADPLLQEYCDLEANREHHLSQDEVDTYLADSFWRIGDANRDAVVNINDMQVIARSLGTDDTWPIGEDWNQFNPDGDLNEDGKVDATDLGMAGRSYGRSGG